MNSLSGRAAQLHAQAARQRAAAQQQAERDRPAAVLARADEMSRAEILHESFHAVAHVLVDGGDLVEVAQRLTQSSRCLGSGRKAWGAVACLPCRPAAGPGEGDLDAARRAIARTTGRACTERDLRSARRAAEGFFRSHRKIISAVASALGASRERRLTGSEVMQIILLNATSEQLEEMMARRQSA